MVGSVDATDLDTSVLLGGTLPFVGVCLFQPNENKRVQCQHWMKHGNPSTYSAIWSEIYEQSFEYVKRWICVAEGEGEDNGLVESSKMEGSSRD